MIRRLAPFISGEREHQRQTSEVINQLIDLVESVVGITLTNNSTTTPLNAGATYTGTWIDVSAYETVVISLAADQHCTFTAQFSPDGSNADSTLSRYYVVGKINPPQPFVVTRRYFRLVITNTTASNMTYLRAQVLAGGQSPALNTPVDATMAQTYPAISVRPTDWGRECALGRRQGVVAWNKFGYNADVDAAAEETIWAAGGLLVPLTTARTLSVVSASANDAAAGTGLRTIRIYGIDASRNEQTVDVTMNGTTPVVTTETWLGVNRVAPLTAGTGLTNAGAITLTATTDLTTQAFIPAGAGVTQQAFLFTSADTSFLATWLTLSVAKLAGGTAPRVTVLGYVRDFTTGCRYEIFRKLVDTSVTNEVTLVPPQPFVIPGSSLLEFTASTNTNDTSVTLRFSGEMHDNIGT